MAEVSDAMHLSPELHTEKFGTITSRGSLTNYLENIGDYFGLEEFSLQHMPLHRRRTIERDHIADNWNHDSFARYYVDNDIINKTQAPDYVSRSMLPVQLEICEDTFDKGDFKFSIPIELWREANIELLTLIPVFNSVGRLGLLIYCGKKQRLTNGELMQMSLLGRQAFDLSCKIISDTPSEKSDLSKKEFDCLYWSSRGKTTSEISNILSLSEPTINFYFGKAIRKLNAVNRIQAVAIFMTQHAF